LHRNSISVNFDGAIALEARADSLESDWSNRRRNANLALMRRCATRFQVAGTEIGVEISQVAGAPESGALSPASKHLQERIVQRLAGGALAFDEYAPTPVEVT
jgi:hypothetical protein